MFTDKLAERENQNGVESLHIGADLGKLHDFTCWCLLRKFVPYDVRSRALIEETRFELLGMKRFPLQTSYLTILESIVNRLKYEPFDTGTPTNFAFDKTGVGIAISDLIRADEFLEDRLNKLLPITITGGRSVTETDDGINVGKFDLIMSLVLVFQRGRLEFPGDLPELPNLIEELQNFEMKNTASGNQTFSAKGSGHDDMVLALALAIWSATHGDDTDPDNDLLRRAFDPRGGTRGNGGRGTGRRF